MQTKNQKSVLIQVSILSIFVNLGLAALKLVAGLLAFSSALISDAIHSASDVFSCLIVLVGIKLSNKNSDKKHPYGHERIECVAALLLAFILAAIGLITGYEGIQKIIQGVNGELATPGILALVAAIVSILVKEGMFWFTRYFGKKYNSTAMIASAWHSRADAMSSVGSLIGVGGAMLGIAILDPLASVVICLFILKVAFDISKEAVGKMLDTSCDSIVEDSIRQKVLKTVGVGGLNQLKTRQFGNKIYVDIDIFCNGNMTLSEIHKISLLVKNAVESIEDVKGCTVTETPTKP